MVYIKTNIASCELTLTVYDVFKSQHDIMNLTTPTMQLHYLREYSIRFLFNLKILIGLSNETGMCIHIYHYNIRLMVINDIGYSNSLYLINNFKRPAQKYQLFSSCSSICSLSFWIYNP